ncbi:peptidase S41 [Flavobacterium tructae]|uniref:S41 family peptidase n=1 Tax=Flavobacterium tructae TaxID=1114873 RepID=UPI000B5BDDF8|nr:S41 family peptidase [Flavobacterium tructae]OXB23890.1 peptidase S41 [Flavobacterium tructae]
MKYSTISVLSLFLFLSVFLFSCSDNDSPAPVYEAGTNEYVNEWMYQQMKKYYRWNSTMPEKGRLDLSPKEYFAGLLQKDDRYSYAMHPEQPETAQQSLRRKFGFEVSFFEFESKFYGVILYVLEDSPAKRNGLKRGQLITKIEGTTLNQNNYDALYTKMTASTQLNLQTVSYAVQSGFSNVKEISILQGYSFSQPINYTIIEAKSKKVGYVEISHFDAGQAQAYFQTFQELKNKSITELVVDLRYNGGGDIAAATALSIILAPNIQSNTLFIKFEGNTNGGNVDQSFKQALESNESKISFDALRNAHPSINRVYILCGQHTASASELIINNLKPYMEVITIGNKTFGKDVAGFPLIDDRISTKKGWTLYPAIYKLFNSRHEGNYSKGIDPLISLDEIQQPEVFPLGNSSEVLLAKALNFINGNTAKNSLATAKTFPLSANEADADFLMTIH